MCLSTLLIFIWLFLLFSIRFLKNSKILHFSCYLYLNILVCFISRQKKVKKVKKKNSQTSKREEWTKAKYKIVTCWYRTFILIITSNSCFCYSFHERCVKEKKKKAWEKTLHFFFVLIKLHQIVLQSNYKYTHVTKPLFW